MVDMTPDMFMKLDGIKGESADSAHKGEIDVLSFAWTTNQGGSAQIGSGAGAGKAQLGDLIIKKHTCISTPVLMVKHLTGAPIASAVLTLRKAGANPLEYVKVTLTNCIVTRMEHGADDSGHTETVAIQFSTVKYEYTPQNADGSGGAVVTGGFDASRNTAL